MIGTLDISFFNVFDMIHERARQTDTA